MKNISIFRDSGFFNQGEVVDVICKSFFLHGNFFVEK